MKKIQLSIPKPCDAAWSEMTPTDRGRFCGACQKTVIDFTQMSDRQLAGFFKSKPRDVCGQFHTDQLHRDIVLPRKRIPWVKYFFRVIWPAWVVFFTSCGQKTRATGKPIVVAASPQSAPGSHAIMGDTVMMPPDQPLVTVAQPEEVTLGTPAVMVKGEAAQPEVVRFHEPLIRGDVEAILPSAGSETIDTVGKEVPTVISARPLDTVVVTGYHVVRRGEVMMGAVAQVTSCNIVETSDTQTAAKALPAISTPKVFPNPVRRGGMLTVSVATPEGGPDLAQLFSAGGALVAAMKQAGGDDTTVFNISIPPGITPGIYFLRLTNTRRKASVTEKILIQ